MPLPKLVIFDCDGVLVDSERICHEVLHRMLSEIGVDLSLQETIDRFIGTSTPGFLQLVCELQGGQPPPTFLESFRGRTIAAFGQHLTAVPGIVDVLSSLTTPCCVASNGTHAKMAFSLRHTGLLARFSGRIFSAEDVTNPKPAPDLFVHAARCLSVDPRDCVVVEDTPTGVRAARAAGMRALGYAAMTPAQRLLDAGAHRVFESMDRLPALLSECRMTHGLDFERAPSLGERRPLGEP